MGWWSMRETSLVGNGEPLKVFEDRKLESELGDKGIDKNSIKIFV